VKVLGVKDGMDERLYRISAEGRREIVDGVGFNSGLKKR
jgi:hypothetical protein